MSTQLKGLQSLVAVHGYSCYIRFKFDIEDGAHRCFLDKLERFISGLIKVWSVMVDNLLEMSSRYPLRDERKPRQEFNPESPRNCTDTEALDSSLYGTDIPVVDINDLDTVDNF